MLGSDYKKVDIHVRRIALNELPHDPEELKDWLSECWETKNK